MFPDKNLLTQEYNEGWLDADSLKEYIQLGNINQDDYDQITGQNK